MRRTTRISSHRIGVASRLLLLGLMLLAVNASAKTAPPRQPGEFIVQVQNETELRELLSDFAPYQLRIVKCLSQRMHIWLLEYQVSGLKASDEDALLDDVRFNPRVLRAQYNHHIQQRAMTPNDPSFGVQWALNNTGQSGGTPDADIDAPEAWDIATGGATALGEQIVVAIIDGGFDLGHVDVSYFKNTLESPGDGIDDDGNGYIDDYDGWNAYNSSGSIPVDNHGQHVAGIAGATGNNGTGIAGVNWGVKIMPIAGATSLESEAIEAYGYVHAMRSIYNETNGAAGAFVVSTNASFGIDYGDPADFPLWCGIYDSLGAVGVLSAGATANIGMDIDVNGDVPTACVSDYLISVTNTNRNDVRNSGAAWGLTTIDLGAPGTSIYSTLPNDAYGSLTGTSMATPHVAGAIALMYAGACPGFIAQYKTDPAGVALLVKQALLDGTDPNASLAGKTVSGGRLNVYNSLLLVRGYICGTQISHSPLPDTKDIVNPYEVVCTIVSDTTIDNATAELHYVIDAIETIASLLPTGSPNEYHAYIPAQGAGTMIDYWMTATDFHGTADTTETFSFRVLDYDVILSPASASAMDEQNMTVEYSFTVTNNGVLDDEFDLSLAGNSWTTAIYDASATTPLSTTGMLAADESIGITVKVDIPTSFNGDFDVAELAVTSMGDPSVSQLATITTTSLGGPLEIPFNDSFPSTSVDVGLWTTSSGVTINTGALAPPSPPYAANFNGAPGGADTLVSQRFHLSGLADLSLWYSYEQTGSGEAPDPNDDLYVEFYNDGGAWEELNHHLGADPNMSAFERVILPLPLNAYHDQFRLRFRNMATVGSFDDWFIDDVKIDYVPQVAVTPMSITESLISADSVSADLIVSNIGQGTLEFMVTITPASPWLAIAPMSGMVAPGSSATLTAWLSTADTGTVTANIEIQSNDPGGSPWIVPVNLTVTACACPFQSDFDEDTYLTSLDLSSLIDILFAGSPDIQDPYCLIPRGDLDCDGYSTAVDMSVLIDHLFAGGAPPCNPCNP